MRRTIKLLAQEHPIIDIIAEVPSSLLKKYNLPSNATVSPTPALASIYKELVANFPYKVMAAGSALNALRACQVFNNSLLFHSSY